MHSLWCWIAANAQPIIATFTILYFIATALIFNEARKSTDAATQAAHAAKNNADAAKKSASAAESSANAAFQSVHLTRQQIEEQADLGRSIVQTTVDSAIAAIEHWKSLNLPQLAIARIPNTDDLVPSPADSAVEHARRISQEAAVTLSSAFDDLRKARRELETLRFPQYADRKAELFQPTCKNFELYLGRAFAKLLVVRALVP